MMKKRIFAIVLVALMMLCVLPAHAQEQEEEFSDYTKVIDKHDQLSDADEARINQALAKASEQAGVPVCAYVFIPEITYYGYDKYVGDDFLAEYTCDCDRGRLLDALACFSDKELDETFDELEKIEVCCRFCDKKYYFTREDIEKNRK